MQHISPPSPSSSILLPLFPAGLSAEDVTEREGACEGNRGKPSVEWICALSPPPFLLLPPLLCLLGGCLHPPPPALCPGHKCWPFGGEQESRRVDGGLKTELQCQSESRRMVVTNLKVNTHILLDDNISEWSTPTSSKVSEQL